MTTQETTKTTTLDKVLNLRNHSREKFNKVKLEYINAVTTLQANKNLTSIGELERKLKELEQDYNAKCIMLDKEYSHGFKLIIDEYEKEHGFK